MSTDGGIVGGMAAREDEVTVRLEEIVERARAELGLDCESDTAVVERAPMRTSWAACST